ncbi:hypothetical protein PAPYR_7621 [Paratrimastix pyriformis]|uniref:Uncharacterized protein n=1 Tax=Paratrimastix pyriformis TaxID=342808 RepID=A0ABQ8UF32_9EUKA|nr:hypothetical protein PAPYR_7621 [Paratrimastix pyriformis]
MDHESTLEEVPDFIISPSLICRLLPQAPSPRTFQDTILVSFTLRLHPTDHHPAIYLLPSRLFPPFPRPSDFPKVVSAHHLPFHYLPSMLFPWDSNHRNQLPITFLSRNICSSWCFTKLTVVDISYIPSSRYHDHIPSLYKTNFSEQSPFLPCLSLFSPHPEGTYAFPHSPLSSTLNLPLFVTQLQDNNCYLGVPLTPTTPNTLLCTVSASSPLNPFYPTPFFRPLLSFPSLIPPSIITHFGRPSS